MYSEWKRAAVWALALIVLVAGGGAVQCEAADNGSGGQGETHGLVVGSTSGGSVIVPGEDYFSYRHATVVDLVAEAEEGYRFVAWTGEVEEIEDPAASHTTITMLSDYEIEAVFERIIYRVTAASGRHGTTEPAGEVEVAHGEDKMFTITPNEGYRIADVRLTVNDEKRSVYDELEFKNDEAVFVLEEVRTDYVLFAEFESIIYTLTIESTEGGQVTEPGETSFTYNHGTEVELSVRPEPLYRFAGWTGDTYAIEDRRAKATTITMYDDYEITAEFDFDPLELRVSSTDGGSVDMPGEGRFPYDEGEQVPLQAAAEEGYQFVGWRGDIEAIDDPDAHETTIEMHEDYKIKAAFAVAEYDLDVESTEGGTVTVPGEGVYRYEHTTRVSLRVSADEGYAFVGWRGDVDTIADPEATRTALDMRGNYAITAEFASVPRELELASTEGGEVRDPGEGTFTYEHGDEVALSAEADTGYVFVRWGGDIGEVADTGAEDTTIAMRDDYEIAAEFERKVVELDVTSTEGGQVTAPDEPMFRYDYGEEVSLSVKAEEGYEFVGWTGDIETITHPDSEDTEIEMLDNYTITAEFSPKEYELTVRSTTGGKGVEPGERTFTYEHGTTVDLWVEAEEGYEFVGWIGDIETIVDPDSEETEIEMVADCAITAEFELKEYELELDSTAGGEVFLPGERTFHYEHGHEVPLRAVATGGYRFTRWTGDIAYIADPDSENTTVEMRDDYEIVAEFELITLDPDESIQDAIDRAEAGDVIGLGPGEWQEDLYINKDVILRGQGAGETVIRSAAHDRPVIEIANDGQGRSPQVEIRDLTVTGGRKAEGYGLLIKDSAQVTISEGHITDNTHGIMLWLQPTVTIRDSKIAENREDGIVLSFYCDATLERNTIQANGRYGVSLYQRPCFDVGLYFRGSVSGAGNTIPGPREPDANERSAVCPSELEFLKTDEGGEWHAPR
ncbi:MAG: right-handed parallel beta-helix repeat-containing protein [Candidatus Bipolaricaulota bacterium]